MNEQELEAALKRFLDELVGIEPDDCGDVPIPASPEVCGIDEVRTFENAGVMTMNRGLVVSMADGTEFQLTIVQSN